MRVHAALGLQVSAATIRELCEAIDSNGDGLISLNDWKQALGPDERDVLLADGDDDDDGGSGMAGGIAGGGGGGMSGPASRAAASWTGLDGEGDGLLVGADGEDGAGGPGGLSAPSVKIKQLHLPELEDGDTSVARAPVMASELRRIKASLVSPRGFKSPPVWAVHAKGAKMSVWAPSLSRPPLSANNKARVCLGHYAGRCTLPHDLPSFYFRLLPPSHDLPIFYRLLR